METGNSYEMNQKVYKKFLNWIHTLCPWQFNWNEFPHTIWRNILYMLVIFIACYIDGEMTEKWNEYYHWTSIPQSEKQFVDETTADWIKEYFHLNDGDPYWISPFLLLVVLTGDGIDIPKSPSNIRQGTFGLSKVHLFNHIHLQQTLMIAFLWLLSGLSHYDSRIAKIYHKCSFQMKKSGGISVWSEKAKCKLCIRWERKDNSDWTFASSVIYRSLPHSSSFPFLFWIHHIGKKYFAVKKTPSKIFKAICAGIKDEHMPWNLKLSDIKSTDNFYCLTLPKHHEIWANQIEEYMAGLANLAQLTKEQQHKKRRAFALEKHQPLLYKTPLNMVQYILDVMHDILRHSGHELMVLTILCWCYFGLTIDEIIVVLSHICKLNIQK